MRVLVHLGLNKCASTYIQNALDRNRDRLAAQGVWYPEAGPRTCHYGLSKYYGFGPESDEIMDMSVADAVKSATSSGCHSIILSSEYLSLCRPKAARQLRDELELCGCDAEFVMFSRQLGPWIRSLFNQYVKTVDQGRYLPGIDAFVDQVLENRAIDIAARYTMWEGLVGQQALSHYRLSEVKLAGQVLQPFTQFSGVDLDLPETSPQNESVHPDALFQIGLLRRRDRTRAEEQELTRLLSGGQANSVAPAGYMQISETNHARLRFEIEDNYAGLPYQTLERHEDPQATSINLEHRFPAQSAA